MCSLSVGHGLRHTYDIEFRFWQKISFSPSCFSLPESTICICCIFKEKAQLSGDPVLLFPKDVSMYLCCHARYIDLVCTLLNGMNQKNITLLRLITVFFLQIHSSFLYSFHIIIFQLCSGLCQYFQDLQELPNLGLLKPDLRNFFHRFQLLFRSKFVIVDFCLKV